jgi:uncharacterized protein (DUF1330 family)
MRVTLCVLLWANDGCERALIEYENKVLPIVEVYGGSVLERARTAGTGDEPLEIQLLEFPSEHAFDQYMGDEHRTALADERELAVARTDILRVDLV